MTGRRTEPVPIRTGTGPEERARLVALFGLVCLLPLGVLDWLLGTAVMRYLVCSEYERGGVLDCGGSAGFDEAFQKGGLAAFLLLVLQTWLVARIAHRMEKREPGGPHDTVDRTGTPATGTTAGET